MQQVGGGGVTIGDVFYLHLNLFDVTEWEIDGHAVDNTVQDMRIGWDKIITAGKGNWIALNGSGNLQ